MGARGAAVGVLARYNLALLSDAHAPVDRAGRLCRDGAAGWRAAPADRAAAAVEEPDLDVVRLAGFDNRRLGLRQFPDGGQVSAVLVAVGVAQHHLDLAVAHQGGRRLRQPQQLVEDARGVLKVADGFEQRHDARERG